MRIRHPWLIGTAGFAASWALRLWLGSLRIRYRPLGVDTNPHQAELPTRYIYAMWHEYLLLPVYCYARPDIHVLISRHGDAQILAAMCRNLRIPVIRGSTARGGVVAVRKLLDAGHETHLAITPDGPRGPRRQVQPGLIYLASRLGLPIVPVGFGLDRPWRASSWDRFALPRPFSRAACVTAEPILVPADANRAVQDRYCQLVEEALSFATGAAEDWAQTDRWPQVRTQIHNPVSYSHSA